MFILHSRQQILPVEFVAGLGIGYKLPWVIGLLGIQHIFYSHGQGKWGKPSPIQLADAERSIVNSIPNGDAVGLLADLQGDNPSIHAVRPLGPGTFSQSLC